MVLAVGYAYYMATIILDNIINKVLLAIAATLQSDRPQTSRSRTGFVNAFDIGLNLSGPLSFSFVVSDFS
jgi:hypothetical protein